MRDEISKKTVGQAIRNIRLHLGLTLDEFGKKLSPPANDSNVSRWERGVSLPNKTRLKKIAELGGVSVPYLFDGAAIEGAIRSVQNRLTSVENQIPKLEQSLKEVKDKDESERLSITLSNCNEGVRIFKERLDMLKLIQDDVKNGKTIENLDEELITLTSLKGGNFRFEPLPNKFSESTIALLNLPKEIHEKETEKHNLANMLSNEFINYKGIKLTDNDKKLILNVLEGIKTQFENYKEN